MLRQALIDAHYALYQTVVYLVGFVAIIHLLFGYGWQYSLGCSAVTVASYWLGQGIVALVQRGARRGRSF